jgi:hypothetical protein
MVDDEFRPIQNLIAEVYNAFCQDDEVPLMEQDDFRAFRRAASE